MRTRTLGTYSSHMPVKTLTLERQERDETRNMAKQTGVHDVIDVIVPALMLPRLCQAASMCCTRMPSTRAARRLGRSWPCAGCAGVTRGASISDGCLWGDDDVLPFMGSPYYNSDGTGNIAGNLSWNLELLCPQLEFWSHNLGLDLPPLATPFSCNSSKEAHMQVEFHRKGCM